MTETASRSADFVVVGAGSAGSIVASRLASAGASVVVLEAGGTDRRPDVALAIGLASVYRRANWLYPCAADPSKDGCVDSVAAGRIVGGSGSINAMVYVRGRAEDYDRWADNGCPGWSFEEVLPHFREIEDWVDGPDEYRGRGGPISVTWCAHRHPIDDAFIDAAATAGYTRNPDHNGATQLGVSRAQVNQRRGLRSSSAREYLHRSGRSDSLSVRRRSQAVEITFAGSRATGVRCADGNWYRAQQEVVLCAGAIGTPALLLRSGVGPSGSVARVPGVGQNLQDHRVVTEAWRSKVPTINSLGPGDFVRAVADLIARGRGAFTGVPFEAELFTDDFQIAISPMHYTIDKISGRTTLERTDGFSVSTVVLHPNGRGRVGVVGGRPLVEFERLADPDDVTTLARGVSLSRALIRDSASMRGVADGLIGDDKRPVDTAFLASEEISIAHAAGTCRMGADDGAVVSPRLEVRDTRGLRIIDASVMPTLPSGNPNAATMMIAHRAVDLMSV